ncbi:Gp49 family protein [Aliamphritea hakodatensis]|uniref:Gp49 family protein n=1 Tax=Aliamphritea hakodatensis TaxID=2895352 RepID=UPI0022FD7B52|nr:Gp49 family protein [Aliamphritea hakodatensis]
MTNVTETKPTGDAAGVDAAMEADIIQKGLTAPRVTKESIDAIMAAVDYHTYVVPGTTTTVAVAMIHGFTLCQEITACVDAKNFDEELGRKYAIEKAAAVARDKLWELEGYTLKFGCVSLPDIARVAHEINRAYCEAMGDMSQEEWSQAPAWQRDSAINGVNFHLMNPDADAGLSHINWMAEKKADGWVYGETKDPEAKTHPCMVPFNQLPIEQQAKDFLFRAVVHALK